MYSIAYFGSITYFIVAIIFWIISLIVLFYLLTKTDAFYENDSGEKDLVGITAYLFLITAASIFWPLGLVILIMAFIILFFWLIAKFMVRLSDKFRNENKRNN